MNRAFAAVAAIAMLGCGSAPVPAPVEPGIDVLLRDSIHLVEDFRVGLLTNQSGVDAKGTTDLTRLLDAGVQVTAIFSPEHGYRGVLDQERITDTTEAMTGIAIFSLYGDVRAPTTEMLERVDVLVVDLQDIGGRPYTYISSLLHATEAAAQHDVPVVVLDRPNPIGGILVQGPVRDPEWTHDFIGLLEIPQRHGLTIGELAYFGNDVLRVGADLTVVPASGWTRDRWFDETGLPWVRPSPSMPNLESATHYPGLVLFEATNLSVGRGTDAAFRAIGAPWLNPQEVIEAVGQLPGVRLFPQTLSPVEPPDGKFGGMTAAAIGFQVTDRERYDPVRTAVEVLAAMHAAHPDHLAVSERRLAQLLGTDAVWEAIVTNVPVADLERGWRDARRSFWDRAARYRLYN